MFLVYRSRVSTN
ncbi:UNVERIFIED_CONTAM: hypothetical protein GTU68_061609 [Idotea baltica]|nr:hypothetical protein [Idotea baltica]